MATKPWESTTNESPDTTPVFKAKQDSSIRSSPNATEHEFVKIRRNNISTRISSRSPVTGPITRSAWNPCSEFVYDESTSSNSSASTFDTPLSSNINILAEGNNVKRRSYMNLTASIKAKQRSSNYLSQSIENLQFHKKPQSPLSKGLARRSTDCELYL